VIVAVTGASGHLGSQLLQTLQAAGHTPRAVLLPGDPAPHLRQTTIEIREADVRDAAALPAALDGAEAVIHLAAVVKLAPDRDGKVRAVNVDGTRHVLAAARAVGIRRLLHCSSHHALHRFPLSEPLHEGRPLALDEPCDYHRSKAEAEREVLQAVEGGQDVVILSPGTMLGPNDHLPSILARSLIDLFHGRLPAVPDVVSDYVDVRDVAAAMVRALADGQRGERYLLGGRVASMKELLVLLAAATGRPMPKVVLPVWMFDALVPFASIGGFLTRREPALTREMVRSFRSNKVVSHAKAEAALGFTLRPLEETLVETFAWFRSRGWLETGAPRIGA